MIGVVRHGRASAAAAVKPVAFQAGLHFQASELGEHRRTIPDILELLRANISGDKCFLLQKGAGIDLAGWRDAAGHLGRSAHVEPFSSALFRGETEEGISCADPVVGCQPFCEGFELLLVRPKLILTLFPSP